MKKLTMFITIISFAILSSLPASGQKADFTGKWKLDRTKSVLAEYTPVLIRVDVNIKGDSLLTERVYDTGDGQEYPFTENLTLDGKESRITIYDMPRKASASWSEQDGTLIVETTTTFNGDSGEENFVSKETWKADAANKTLTINYKNTASGGEVTGVFSFIKSE